MDITDVDLNLLVVFDALLRTRSVTRAARTLGMSQPATSFALNRLRKMLGDPLFVRTSRGIHPTPYAEGLAAPLEAILDRIRSDLLQQPTFDPATAAAIGHLRHAGHRRAGIPAAHHSIDSRRSRPACDVRTVNLPVDATRAGAAHRRSRSRARLLSGAEQRGVVSAAAVHAFVRLHRARRPSRRSATR